MHRQKIFYRQQYHLLAIIISVIGFNILDNVSAFTYGQLWSIDTTLWLWLGMIIPVVHQIYVWLAWRLEYHEQLISRTLGTERGFQIYFIIFMFFMIARFVYSILIAIANQGSLGGNSLLFQILGLIILIPVVITMYAVINYFGLKRAAGADHFLEDYRHLGKVEGGIYDYVDNAMYWFALLVLFVPALLLDSAAGLITAAYSYVYIWVHYYTVESPDLEEIFGN